MAHLAAIAPFGFAFDPARFMAAYRMMGVTTTQFYRNEKKPPTLAEALRAAASAGVRYDSIHGVFGEHIDPTSPDADHRARCLDLYEDEARLTKDLGGTMIVVHPSGWNPGRREMSHAEAREAMAPRRSRLDDWLKRLAAIGERLGVVYLIENQPFNCPLGHDAIDLARQIVEADSPSVRMCFDTGHAHITGDLFVSLRACANVISYLHVHDNDKKVDDHRMPGLGNIEWESFAATLRSAKVHAPRMLEVFEEESKVELRARQGFGAQLRAWCAVE